MDLSLPQNQDSVSANLNSELPPPPPEFSSDNHASINSLDDLLASHSHATDVGLEWLSTFVEDCLSSSGSCLLQLPKNVQTNSSPVAQQIQSDHNLDRVKKNTSFFFQRIGIPLKKARSKRKRRPVISSSFLKRTRTQHFTDPTLLQQTYWLADSELIINPPDENIVKTSNKLSSSEEEVVVVVDDGQGQPEQRRCSHCLAQRTPQWRAGPLGPKTLCNACGVRYKSGRLLPEYRPAKSPTFVSFKHSNSHKKVMEMRMSHILQSNS